MVVNAGMPRSGSTWIKKLTTDILRQVSGFKLHEAYWKFPDHIRMSQDDPRRVNFDEVERRVWEHPNTTIFHYKSHEYDTELLTMCPYVAIITSHRCLEDEIESACNAGWCGRLPRPGTSQYIANKWLEYLSWYSHWKQHRALDIDYTIWKQRTRAQNNVESSRQLRQLYGMITLYLSSALGILLNIPYIDVEEAQQEANPSIPHNSSGADFSTFIASVRERMDSVPHMGLWCRT